MFNILVVEDNRDLRELLCDALTGEGYRAYSSSDGNEALTRLEETFFDLIIADIMMPNMGRLAAHRRIEASRHRHADSHRYRPRRL